MYLYVYTSLHCIKIIVFIFHEVQSNHKYQIRKNRGPTFKESCQPSTRTKAVTCSLSLTLSHSFSHTLSSRQHPINQLGNAKFEQQPEYNIYTAMRELVVSNHLTGISVEKKTSFITTCYNICYRAGIIFYWLLNNRLLSRSR